MSKLAEKLASAQKTGRTKAPRSIEAKPRASAPVPEKKKRTDWEAVERDYRTGQFTLRELEAKHGADNGLISRKAKKDGWSQDLSKAIKAATNAKLVEELVSKEISNSQQKVSNTVLAAAELNKEVILGHRRDIKFLRNMAFDMAEELQQIGKVDLKGMASMLESDDLNQEQLSALRDGVNALTKLPVRILSVQRLAQTVTRVQALERQAHGLDDPETPPPIDEIGDLSDQDLDARISERLRVAGL
jgi:hypothetical protein